MEDRPNFEDEYKRAMSPVVSRVDERYWEATRGSTIGGAGLSTAVVFLLTQIGLGSVPLKLSFACAALAIPLWLALWQIVEAYAFYGRASHGHFLTVRGSGIGVAIFLVAGLLLLASFSMLIWHFSPLVACLFFAACLAMIAFVFWHNIQVRAWSERGS